MVSHDLIPTITVRCDWDLPLVDQLRMVALFYYDEGVWEWLDDVARTILAGVPPGEHPEIYGPLRQRYNQFIIEMQKHSFALDTESDPDDHAIFAAEQALVEELLEFYADPEMYVIVHVFDDDAGEDAWFVCYQFDLEELGLPLPSNIQA